MSDATPTADATDTTPLATLAETGNPALLIDHEDVTTEVVEIETDAAHFERYQNWYGMAIAGITNDDGDVLLVKNTDPDVCHDWVLPHGAVRAEDDDWAETTVDWVEGLTGVSATIEEVVHVRRNDVAHETDQGNRLETTTYHVIFSGRPRAGESIQHDVRYDYDDDWIAEWHATVRESVRETERGDVELFVDSP